MFSMKQSCVALFVFSVTSIAYSSAVFPIQTASNHLIILADTCPKGCESCWNQCTTNDDCGSGHKCITGACGARCVKE